VYVGSDDCTGDLDEVVNFEQPHVRLTAADQTGKKDTDERAVPLPATVAEVRATTLWYSLLVTNLRYRRKRSSTSLRMREVTVMNMCMFASHLS
jgi:hypothetical protein